MEKPKVNAVICSHCITYIESEHRHDFKECDCPKLFGKDAHKTIVMVDGGREYVRRGFCPQSAWIEIENWEWTEAQTKFEPQSTQETKNEPI